MAIFKGLLKPDDPFYRRSFLIMHRQPYNPGGKKPGTDPGPPSEGDDPPPAPTETYQNHDPQWLEDQNLNHHRPPTGHAAAKQSPKNESDPE
jgi:hypothetical protein